MPAVMAYGQRSWQGRPTLIIRRDDDARNHSRKSPIGKCSGPRATPNRLGVWNAGGFVQNILGLTQTQRAGLQARE
jgi:hypothetical protein